MNRPVPQYVAERILDCGGMAGAIEILADALRREREAEQAEQLKALESYMDERGRALEVIRCLRAGILARQAMER